MSEKAKLPIYHPRHRYHPEKGSVLLLSQADEDKLGPGWFKSPAEFGVETCPGVTPDPAILAKKKVIEPEQPKPKKASHKYADLKSGDGA